KLFLPLEKYLKLDTRLARRFTHLSIHPPLNIAHYSVLFDFATKFTSLTKLVISLDNLPIHRLTTCLSLLQQLFFLSIFIDFRELELSNQRSIVEESIENSV